MSDTNDPTPLDKMTPEQLRAASIAALPQPGPISPAAASAAGPVDLDKLSPDQQRDAAIAGLPPVTPPALKLTEHPKPPRPVARYRFDARGSTVLDNPEDFPPTAA